MSIRLIAMDLDGTLLNSNKSISAYSLDVLRQAADRGIHIVPATGRSYRVLPEEILSFSPPYLLTNSGASVLDRKTCRLIYCAAIPVELLYRCMEIIMRHDIVCNYVTAEGAYLYTPHLDRLFSFVDAGSYWGQLLLRSHLSFDDYDTWLAENGSLVLKVNLFFQDSEKQQAVREELIQITGLDICSSVAGNLEITSCKATKGRALMALADHLGIQRDEIMAFGDSDNDLSLINAAGIGVAMANALPEIQAAADRVTLSNDKDGVARAIEQWVFE